VALLDTAFSISATVDQAGCEYSKENLKTRAFEMR
jgi:hypothetical protein